MNCYEIVSSFFNFFQNWWSSEIKMDHCQCLNHVHQCVRNFQFVKWFLKYVVLRTPFEIDCN